jgi:hypothetical protein
MFVAYDESADTLLESSAISAPLVPSSAEMDWSVQVCTWPTLIRKISLLDMQLTDDAGM